MSVHTLPGAISRPSGALRAGERCALGAPALEADDRRLAVGQRRIVGDDPPVVFDEVSVLPEGHASVGSRMRIQLPWRGCHWVRREGDTASSAMQARVEAGASDAAAVGSRAAVWMPHSVLSRPRQRPARASSPGATLRGAGHAADRRIALGDQRVLGQVVALGIGLEVAADQLDQRVDLDALAVGLEQRAARRARVLEALAAGEPGVEALERARAAARSCGSGSRGRDWSSTARGAGPCRRAAPDRA